MQTSRRRHRLSSYIQVANHYLSEPLEPGERFVSSSIIKRHKLLGYNWFDKLPFMINVF